MARILIIDDEPQLLDMLGQTFEREGYDIVKASNGKEGIKLYRENPVDLIITDIIMPEKEGIETIFELRKDFPDLKIIAISGGGRIEPEEYLDIAKKTLLTNISFAQQTNSGTAKYLAFYQMVGKGYGFIEDYPEEVLQVTKERAGEVARRYLDPDKYTLVVVGKVEE